MYQLKSVSSFYGRKFIKPYSAKQLLNMFQLWCEWALRHIIIPKNDSILNKVMQNVDQNIGQPGFILVPGRYRGNR